MIHATIIEQIGSEEGEERERLNRVLTGRLPEPVLPTGPVRYAKPGEMARNLKTVPVHEAIAALRSRIPGANVGR